MNRLYVLAVMLVIAISIQDSPVAMNDNNNRPSVAYLLSRYRPRRAMEGVNVCACCMSDLVSICCGACMKRQRQLHGSSATATSSTSSHSAPQPATAFGSNLTKGKETKLQQTVTIKSDTNDERDHFVHRLSTLQASACRCCAHAPTQRTRCCHWCGTMKDLLPK